MKHPRGNEEDRNKLRQKSPERYSKDFYLMYCGGCRNVKVTLEGKMDECPNDEKEALKCSLPGKHPHTVHFTMQFYNPHIEIHDADNKTVWDAKIPNDPWNYYDRRVPPGKIQKRA